METIEQVPTGNGEPDVYADARGRAYWSDGSRVTMEDVVADMSEVLLDVLVRHGLTFLDKYGAERSGSARAE